MPPSAPPAPAGQHPHVATATPTATSPTATSPAATSPAGSPARSSRPGLVLLTLSLAQLMAVLDATIVNIALPSAQRSLGFSTDDRQWIVTGYALAFGSLLLLGGRLSDFFGRRKMFMVGLVGFGLASALGGAATGFTTLLIARVLQGAFGAVLAPAALSLLSTTFTEPAARGRAFGIYGAISGAGGAVGLLLGGVLTEYASWRWCLYVNLAFAGIALLGAVFVLREGQRAARPKLDLPGTITAVLGLVGLVYGLGNAESHGWGAALTLVPIIAGLVLLAVFVVVERRSDHPLLPLRVVLDRNRGGALLGMAITGAAMFGVFLFLTYYLTNTLGFSPVQTGLSFLPMLAALTLGALVSGSVLLPRVGPRPLMPIGGVVAAAGMIMLTRLGLDSSYAPDVLPGLLVVGLGMGFIFGPVQNAGTAGVEASDSGAASAMINTVQQIGGSVGTAVLSWVAAHGIADSLAGRAATPALSAAAAVDGYQAVYWWSAAFLLAAAVITALVLRSGPMTVDPDAPRAIAH